MKKGVKVFILPGQEHQVETLMNDKDIVIVDETKVPCPKEAVILLYIKYESYKDEE